ncbi:MAG: septal ring lytic transglycosylase RlpA family protein [Alphaproteobacteria bacterium]|nr:septal ring lytic transglycosylase RlpA family protein [Alphaproteobacteria bacterium]
MWNGIGLTAQGALGQGVSGARLFGGYLVGCLALIGVVVAAQPAEAKRPGSTYCFVGKCHRVKSLNETRALVGKEVALYASHYSDCSKDRYNPCGLTSSGEPFYPERPDNAASPIYPDGTILLVRHPGTKAAAVLRINNAGPYWGRRKLDVSYATAERLGFRKRGVAKLETKILAAPDRKESRYVRRRAYRPVPGYIGKFDSLEKAEVTAVATMMLDATAASALGPSSSAMMVAARTQGKKARAARQRSKKTIAPIIKQMRLIAEMKTVTAKALRVADVSITASPNRISKAVAPEKGTVQSGRAPSRLLAQAVLNDVSSEVAILERRSSGVAVKLIKTAELGAPKQEAWHDLLRPRLGAGSLLGGRKWGGDVPLQPLPGRAPREYYPGAPLLARSGMTG